MTSIYLPLSFEIIGKSCFSQCHLLASMTFEAGHHFRNSSRGIFSEWPGMASFPHVGGDDSPAIKVTGGS
jgi:hypothetical protein